MIEFIKNYHNKSSLYINTDKKWLWLRIHKTAGTSMHECLKDSCYNDPKNNPEKVIEWVETITEDELNNYFIWSCVRNPYDRFVSIAAMFNINPNHLASRFKTYRRKAIIKRHSEQQHLFTHFNGVQIPNTIIKFESVSDGFKSICKRIGQPEHELSKMNTSNHGHWSDELNDKTIKFVNNYYKLDFKYFNYMKAHIYKNIGGWFNFEDIYIDMVKNHKTGHFVEIGTFMGKSASFMGIEIDNSGKDIRFDTIDTFKGSPNELDKKQSYFKEIDVYKRAVDNLDGLPVNIVVGDSIKVSRKYKRETLDFVFIDGSHEYKDVVRDITVWMKKVKKGGYIGGHDYDNNNVRRAVNKVLGDCPASKTSWLWKM